MLKIFGWISQTKDRLETWQVAAAKKTKHENTQFFVLFSRALDLEMLGRVQKSNSVFILCPIEIVINWRYPGFSMSHLLPERLEGA